MYVYISKVISAVFVVIVYYFIFAIVKLIYSDIRVMSRKKAGLPAAEAFIKPINLSHRPEFEIRESYALSENNVIGRDKKCNIRIDDTFMSHRHAEIFKDGDGYFLEDLSSTNGTMLNGKAVEEEAIELLDGDRICIGQLEFVFLRPELKDGEIAL